MKDKKEEKIDITNNLQLQDKESREVGGGGCRMFFLKLI